MRKLLWITSVLALALPLQAATLLNGMAVHQELGRDQFIGAVYSDTLTENADALLAANQSIRMELKVTAEEGLTPRRFSRLWVEGMAINNRPDVLTAQADNMVAFTSLFKGRLNENDHITYTLNPGEGVEIAVNGVVLGTIDDDQFFSLLLSTWVGRVPLSSTFRDNLLVAGNVDSGLLGRYGSIQPSGAATARIAAWSAPPVPTPAPTPTPAPAPAPEPEPEPEPEVAATEAPSRPVIDIEMPVIAGLPQRPAGEGPAASPSEPAPEPTPESAPAPAVAAAPVQVEEDEEDEEALPLFTAESLLANQRYFSNMIGTIQRNLVYPRRAAQRGQEGSLRVAVVLDRDGNLLSAEILEESRHALLNREAMSKIEELSPYAPIPDTVPGRTHEFTIPITFALASE